MPGDNNICNEHKMHAHRIEAADRKAVSLEVRVQKLEADMIDLRNQSKITIALITVLGGVVSSALTLTGVIAVPLIRGWLGI